VLETAHKLIGNVWGDEGTSRLQHALTVDPDRIRSLAVGQACYIHSGGCTYVQVARPRPSPLPLPAPKPAPAPAVTIPPPRQEQHGEDEDGRAAPAPAPPGLDDVLGPGAPA
jgi:hypothetical protein